MEECAFSLLGVSLVACGSGALWWPGAGLLAVADLHLGRAERLARRAGGLLPPYESAETLARLAAEVARRDPAVVVCLGDSFDDGACAAALGEAERRRLAALMAGRDWVWIAGNHDPGPVGPGGRHLAALATGPLVFRHAPRAVGEAGEVAGHLHPKLRCRIAATPVARPCFVQDGRRAVLPAFGAYTGGLEVEHPAVAGLFGTGACAILTGRPCLALPLGAAERRRA